VSAYCDWGGRIHQRRNAPYAADGRTDVSDALVRSLRDGISGPVVAPSDAEWDAARTGFNVALDQRPAVVA
jgi:hypothetical protein